MSLDYSKWDALELSDDSDVEVHPNVDKKSFIRAKQTQIHMEREQRKQRMAALRYEVALHQVLLKRISALLVALRSRASEAVATAEPGQLAFQAVMESAGDAEDDALPPVPEGLGVDPNQPKTYSAMMAGLLDQVNKAVVAKQPDDRYTAMLEEIQVHETQVQTLIQESGDELAKLEEEEERKITSADIHTGFDSSFVNKKPSAGDESTKIELLNPDYDPSKAESTSKNYDDDDGQPLPLTEEFGKIQAGNYSASLDFLVKHREILTVRESDALLVSAFDEALQGREEGAQQYVHQALLLQYCRSLGRDGVALFFRRITEKEPNNAKDVFYKDVRDTHQRIWKRALELKAERAAAGDDGEAQIQLHAVEPGTIIAINVPEAASADPEVREAREIFEGFSEEMRAALETGELEQVNKALGNMSVDKAEEYVNLFGEAGILSMEEEILDGTTPEGRKKIEELEARHAQKAAEEAAGVTSDPE